MSFERYIDSDIVDKFEFYNYGHALEILYNAFPSEWRELQDCLRKLQLTLGDIWQFQNRTGKVAPEHKRLTRYETMTIDDIKSLPIANIAGSKAHLYLWVPNALLPDGLAVMDAWGFDYKGNIVWEKVRKDGGPDGRGVGFYSREQ